MEFTLKTRPRRLRKDNLRRIFSETRLSLTDLVMPYFVEEGRGIIRPIGSMPGIFRYSIDTLVSEIDSIYNLGIPAVLLFGLPARKDLTGNEAYRKDGIVQRAIEEIKGRIPGIAVITDVCLCSYTSHGHCGILKGDVIDNDKTLEILSKIALSHGVAGADIVAPSAMMDGQVGIIRNTLDRDGFKDIAIMSYSAKFASNFYGPFRDAADSSPKFGDRKTYQLDYHNMNEAIREIKQDIREGADIVMVKPALAYLDVIRVAKDNLNIPLAAYNVSGEYSMIKVSVEKGLVNEMDIVLEVLTSIKRAGADLIITYFAKDVANWVNKRVIEI